MKKTNLRVTQGQSRRAVNMVVMTAKSSEGNQDIMLIRV
jgi:hypothetical protein